MIGSAVSTRSPSRRTTMRRVPWVAGAEAGGGGEPAPPGGAPREGGGAGGGGGRRPEVQDHVAGVERAAGRRIGEVPQRAGVDLHRGLARGERGYPGLGRLLVG